MVVPADWKEIELSKIADIGPGINKALSEMGTGSLYVTVEDIYSGSSLDIGRLGRIRISRSETERFSLQVGDLVLGKSSVKRDGIGYPNLFLGCAEPVVPSGFTYRIRPDKNVLNSRFLLQYLRSRPGRKWIIDNSQSSALTNINSAIVNRYPVTVPPLKEQEAIAEALSDADAAIESLDALIAKKRDVKQATMQQLLTGRTRLPGFTADWKEVRLGDLGSTFGGLTGKSSKDFGDGNSSFVTFMNVMSNVVLNNQGTEKVRIGNGERQSQLLEGDVIFNGSSETPEEVGFGSAVPIELSGLYLNSFCFGFRRKDTRSFDPKFFAYLTRSPLGRDIIRPMAQGSTRYNIAKTNLLNGRFPLPPLKEQEAIAEALTVMDDELEALTEQVSKLRMVKEGMMQDLLTGKVRLI